MPSQTGLHHMPRIRSVICLGACFVFAMPVAALAQSGEGALMLPSEVTLREAGWSQLSNYREIGSFLLAVVETLVFVAAFAFHPRANALRQDTQGWFVQASMFLFGLIGMLVGFLVLHHGYLIGFVIFGLGSLFRFRMASSSLVDGAILIMVTLVGLAVGLDLPVMALVATLAGCATLWFVTARIVVVVELKFTDDAALSAALGPMQDAFAAKGFRILSSRKTDFKPLLVVELSHTDIKAVTLVPPVMDDLLRLGHGVKDWHVS